MKDLFSIRATRGADGQGEPNSDGCVVFKGSKAAGSTVASMAKSLIVSRQKMLDEGALADKGDYLEFTEDYIFSSPSTAASIILGA